jgi:AraC-like DNA-binding protein
MTRGPSAEDPAAFLLVLVEQGVVQCRGKDAARAFGPGTLLLVPPYAAARLTETQGARCSAFAFGRSQVDPLAFDASPTRIIQMLASPGPLAARLPAQAFAEARAVFACLQREQQERGHGFEAMRKLKIMEALLLLARALGAAAVGGMAGPLRFDPQEATRYVQEHFADPLSLAGIASRFGHNPSYFSRLFHREVGVPLVEYINRVRIQRGCQLLKRSDASIVEVALAVGYNNLSHVNRYFRRVMNMSPREYRISSRR